MGVYIKGIEMPKERESFKLTIKYNGLVFDAETGIQVAEAQEVPPHGRLIDADALKKKHHWTDDFYETEYVEVEDIDAAPTVIPAEEGET